MSTPDELVEREAQRVLDLLDERDREWVTADRIRREEAAAASARRRGKALEVGHLATVVIALMVGAVVGWFAGALGVP